MRARPSRPIRSHCYARPTASRFLWLVFLAGCAQALPPGGVAFGLLGDTPYSEAEAERLDSLIDDMNSQPLAFVVHVGDIGSSALACSDEWLLKRKQQFSRIGHPFVLLPGDNEWTDCRAFGRDPLERLAKWRSLFCNTTLKVEVQKGEYCEHVRWEAGGFVFVALNVPGSNNNLRHPEHERRMRAVFAWLDEAVPLARERNGLVVLMQANPFATLPRDGYAALRDRLKVLGEQMPGRMLLVHGDTHIYRDDEPLAGLRRIEVWGSPFVGWLKGSIVDGALRIEAGR